MAYKRLADCIAKRIADDRARAWVNPWRASDAAALRRDRSHDNSTLVRPAFVRDAEKILNSPYYNRLSDKTQVFAFYKNDDLTRRSLHVQLVSRIARSIGAVLGLNTDLIESIALGHDIGHTPFGHAGERFLSALYHGHTEGYFDHNVHGVRVLDGIFRHNLSLQTLSGVL
ncbi:MAG: HD domain-containing protein, partial [Coriobacteriales bacterium]|nr:HD domain-containing protein [Coriobacteriales bacterium]